MMLGMTLSTFTLFHVVLSLVGIASGFIVVYGLLAGKRLDAWTAIFLIFTVLTSATGFLFPFTHLLPSHIVGILSLLVLAVAIVARYARHLEGIWRLTYVVTAMIALYLNVFVAVVQILRKSACFEGPGADAEGAAIPDRSARSHGNFHSADHFRGQKVSPAVSAGRCQSAFDRRQSRLMAQATCPPACWQSATLPGPTNLVTASLGRCFYERILNKDGEGKERR